MEIKICAMDESDKLFEEWATRCVSVLDVKNMDLYKTTNTRYWEFFSDIAAEPIGYSSEIAPKKEQIAKIFEYTKNLTDQDKLLIHCHQGISRSTAIALGVLCQHNNTPQQAMDAVLSVRPQMWPNTLIVKFCDELLDLNGELIKLVNDFKALHNDALYVPQITKQDVDEMQKLKRILEQGSF